MISINRCRNTVLYLEKNNRVLLLLWPLMLLQFAQMDLFENLFYHYNKWVLNETKGLSNTEYGDIQRIYKSK
jgi:hypothetical protein